MDYDEPPAKWIAVTAGLQPKNFEEAAERLERDLRGIFPFERILNFTYKDLEKCTPLTLEKFGEALKDDIFAYGYGWWKTEIVHAVLSGKFGECDGIVWLDSGCEVLDTPWTRNRFRKQIQLAEEYGYLAFELETPESLYTKSDTFSHFPSLNTDDISAQVQATHFFLYGERGREICETWLKTGLSDIHMYNHSPSLSGEREGFVLHKSDQSILSLTMKSLGRTRRMTPPPAGNRGLLSRISAMRAPVWVTRNRTGKTVKGPLIRLVERITK
jgi:hypothetical protein